MQSNPSNPTTPIPLLTRIIEGLAGLLFILTVIQVAMDPLRIHLDNAFYVMVFETISDGAIPYHDWYEINLPMAMYLHTIPVWVAHLLGTHPFAVTQWYLLLLALGSVVLCYVILLPIQNGRALAGSVALVISGMVFFSATYLVLGGKSQILMWLYLPGFFLRWLRYRDQLLDPKLSVLAGLLGAIGISLKPHYPLILVLVEGFWLIRYRTLRKIITPETLAFAGVIVLYGLHFLLIPREMLQGILTALRTSALAYVPYYLRDRTVWDVLRHLYLIFLGLVGAFFVRTADDEPVADLLKAISMMGIAGCVVYVSQTAGFFSQRSVIYTAFFLILLLVFQRIGMRALAENSRLRKAMPALYGVTGVIVCVLLVTFVSASFDLLTQSEPDPFVRYLEAHTEPNDRIMMITTDFEYSMFVRQAGRRVTQFISSEPFEFIFAALPYDQQDDIANVDPALLPVLEHYLERTADDIALQRPDFILIETEGDETSLRGFSFYDQLSDLGFLEEYVLPDYEEIESVGRFRVYRRKE